MKHLPALLGTLAAAALLGGCAPSVPPSAADQQRLMRDAQLGRCGEASAMDKMAARDSHSNGGPEGLGTRGCANAP